MFALLPAQLIPLGIALLLATAGCSSVSTAPWLEDGIERGTLTKTKTADGSTTCYNDPQGVLRRLEYRDQDDQLVEGMCRLEYEHDDLDRQTHVRAFDLHGEPAQTQEHWSEKRTTYALTPSGAKVIEYQYCLPGGDLMSIDAGYAIERIEYEAAADRMHRIEYLTPARALASINYRGNPGVSSVTLAYLQGLQPICMAALWDSAGKIIGRIKISGASYSLSSTTAGTPYANGVYGYNAGLGQTSSSTW